MSILVEEDTPVLVQGITGRAGRFHTEHMLNYGTNIVAGVTPGKKGEKVCGVPVYDSVKEACEEHDVEWSAGFVPPRFAKDAALKAVENGLHQVIITEHVPVHDTVHVMHAAAQKNVYVVGPNCPGVFSPGKAKLGIMPDHIFTEGNVGIISRSGTLTYEVVEALTEAGIGQSTAVGIGGDPVIGLQFIELLNQFENDPDTDAVVVIGEIGGTLEERAAAHIQQHMSKPVIAFIAGRTAPPGKRMGHAGAIISESSGTAQAKINAFKNAGVAVAELPSHIPQHLKNVL